MSMISAQCDKLRELAGDGSMEWVAGPVRASVLCEAADTIWELWEDLQRANAAAQDAEHDESMAWDRVRKAEAENAKLRELAREMHATISRYNSWWDYACKDTRRFADELRELGVEVEP